MASLERAVDVGSFPFGRSPESKGWRDSLDGWLTRAAEKVFEAAPFQLALVGHEVSGTAYASELEKKGVPAERRVGYLWREGGELVWLPPTRW